MEYFCFEENFTYPENGFQLDFYVITILFQFLNGILLGREPPVIEIYPQETVTKNIGRPALFQCRTVQGIPPPTITWTRVDGRPMTQETEVLDNGVIR